MVAWQSEDVPVESLSLKDDVVHFAWEPIGKRFAIIHNEAGASSNARSSVTFYELVPNGKLKEISTYHLAALSSCSS